MSDWELKPEGEEVLDLGIHLSIRESHIARIAQKKLMEFLEKEIVVYANGNLYALGISASGKWQELRKGVGLE